ncbi:TRAP transporter small permease [Gymnodinialimonas sp. 2305UL16-5]|uniref:TRAP transporter small permease n=1 Tax=Gymnodinialimonas mytili TaxID=3126503 RepID=UPI0030AF1F5A
MSRALRVFWSAVDVVIAGILIAMITLVFANVVLRYGFSSGIREAIELSRLCLVWLVMLGAAVVLRRNEHLAVHEILRLLPAPITLALRRLAYVVVLISVLMLFWGAWGQTVANWQNISPLTGLPSGLFYLAGVVSSVLMTGLAVVRIIDPDARLDGGVDDDLARRGADQ